jgi:hypothetical protein
MVIIRVILKDKLLNEKLIGNVWELSKVKINIPIGFGLCNIRILIKNFESPKIYGFLSFICIIVVDFLFSINLQK